MKKHVALVILGLVFCVALAAWNHAFAARPFPAKVSPVADGAGAVTATAGVGLNYATGFEAGEGFALGHIGQGTQPAGCGGVSNPCWGKTAAANASIVEGHIDSANQFMGAQHLRIAHDPATRTNQPNFGLGVDARYPRTADLSARPIAANTVDIEMAISNSFGMDFRVQPQSNSQGFLATSALFFYAGGIYILDDVCGTVPLQFSATGFFWDTLGGYQHYQVEMNPCSGGDINYRYGGQMIYSSCTYAGTNLEQFLVFGDNYPGSHIDVDNVVLHSQYECPCVCGNGIIEIPCDECEVGNDANCPGRCFPPGHPAGCTCASICTFENPCPLENGDNGPYMSSSGYYTYTPGAPFISVNGCGNSYDSAILVFAASDLTTPIAVNDDCNAGPYGDGSDTSAPCFAGAAGNQYGSCTCFANPGEPVLIWMPHFSGNPPAIGSASVPSIRKKSVCAGPSVGACCDTNGADTGCRDNVLAADCVGADKVFTDQGKCAEITCDCIPVCAPGPRPCGDDGCGGSCGSCDDGNACNGVEACMNGQCVDGTPLVCNDGNACNGVETCNPSSGCVPGTPLQCNDGIACNGQETCNPSSGCVSGSPVNCDDGIDCTVDSCNEPDGSCTNDDADCSIPTVSEWGLVVLTLMLLIGAKVYFGRRQAIA